MYITATLVQQKLALTHKSTLTSIKNRGKIVFTKIDLEKTSSAKHSSLSFTNLSFHLNGRT